MTYQLWTWRSDVNADEDYFLIEVFRDGRGRTVIIIYGFGWKGTLAAGKYFDRELSGLLEDEDAWIVGRWEDSNMDGFVNGPSDEDNYSIIATW